MDRRRFLKLGLVSLVGLAGSGNKPEKVKYVDEIELNHSQAFRDQYIFWQNIEINKKEEKVVVFYATTDRIKKPVVAEFKTYYEFSWKDPDNKLYIIQCRRYSESFTLNDPENEDKMRNQNRYRWPESS